MRRNKPQRLFASALLLAMSTFASEASAANWVMLQGTEEGREETVFQPFGFIQPSYEIVFADPVEGLTGEVLEPYNGRPAVFNVVGANDATSTFRLTRVRVAARGTIPQTDRRLNYFVMLAAGQNALVGDNGVVLVDASLTYNAPWFRLRLGQFKLPLLDETTEAVPLTGDIINFSNTVLRLLFERPLVNGQFVGQAYAYRDMGAMIFDAHKVGELELSYAGYVTNGQMSQVDMNDGVDVGGWAQAAWLLDDKQFAGEREELAAYGFGMSGMRNDGVTEVRRTRAGGGIQFRKSKLRLRTEGVWARGAIPAGATPAFQGEPVTVLDGDAWGATALGSYRILPWFEVNAAFHTLRLAPGEGATSRDFFEAVGGAQFIVSPRARLMVNGIYAWAEAPEGNENVLRILETTAPRLVMQATVAF